MNVPWHVGNVDDYRERPEPMSALEATLLLIVLVAASAIIGVLLALTSLVRLVVSIAEDPNAGPYRQVR